MTSPSLSDKSALNPSRVRHAQLRRGSRSLADLFLRSIITLGILYGVLTLLLITAVEAGILNASSALVVGIFSAAIHFIVGPWILDLSLRFLYSLTWVEKSALPEHLATFVQGVCDDKRIAFPSFGIINDGAPQAFTYGHFPSNARVVVSRGLLELLSPEEREAVVAHELGHVCHWDMVVMTIAQLIPLLAYYIYRAASKSSSKSSKRNGAISLVAAAAYVVYICSELVILWFSRVREYYADQFAAETTKNPGALAQALVKIGYGLAAAGHNIPTQPSSDEKTSRFSGAFEALNIFDKRAALSLVVATGGRQNTGAIEPERIKDAMQWDLWNPWASYYEIMSTHPLIAKRLERLGDIAVVMEQEPFIVFDRNQSESYWDEFFVDVCVAALPLIGVMFGIGLVLLQTISSEVNPHWFGLAFAFFGGGQIAKTSLSYKARSFPAHTVAQLLKEVKVSPIRPVSATLEGIIIGKGIPGFIFSEDFIIQDESGIIFLDYRQPLPLWETFFGLLKAGGYQGKTVVVKGWYRRAPVPFLEISEITIKESAVSRRCYTRFAKYISGGISLALGVGLLL